MNESYRKTMLTIIITSLMTGLVSYLLMNYRISLEQKYWKKKFSTERSVILLDKQITLLEDINKDLLSIEILTKDIKLYASACNMGMSGSNTDNTHYNFNELSNKMMKFHLHSYDMASKLQMLPLYYSNKVLTLVDTIEIAINKNFLSNLSIGERVDEKDREAYMQRNIETIPELTNYRLKLIKAMMNDIQKYNEKIW